jgi:hypothetical protein
MPGYALRFRLLPLAVLLCVGSCLGTEGYYRYQDAGTPGTAGTIGTAGTAGPGTAGTGVAGTIGSGGSSGGSAAGTTGAAGTVVTGRGGTTGTAGSTGRGGTTGTGGTSVTGSGGSGAILFMDDFETTKTWDWQGDATHAIVADGATNHVFELNSTMSKQSVAAYAPTGATADHSIEARVKVLSWNGSSSSYIAALCARLGSASSFYYLAIQSNDGKLKIKYNNGSNSSIGTSLDGGFALNTWITLKLSVVGSTLTAYANGAMIGQETDPNITAGTSVGLLVDNARAQFDDVFVRAP